MATLVDAGQTDAAQPAARKPRKGTATITWHFNGVVIGGGRAKKPGSPVKAYEKVLKAGHCFVPLPVRSTPYQELTNVEVRNAISWDTVTVAAREYLRIKPRFPKHDDQNFGYADEVTPEMVEVTLTFRLFEPAVMIRPLPEKPVWTSPAVARHLEPTRYGWSYYGLDGKNRPIPQPDCYEIDPRKPRAQKIAKEIRRGTPFDTLQAGLEYVKSNWRYGNLPFQTPGAVDSRNVPCYSELMLQHRVGVCGNWCEGLAAILKAAGLPTRYIEGYSARGESDADDEKRVLRGHGVLEVWLEGNGWTLVDPLQGPFHPVAGGWDQGVLPNLVCYYPNVTSPPHSVMRAELPWVTRLTTSTARFE